MRLIEQVAVPIVPLTPEYVFFKFWMRLSTEIDHRERHEYKVFEALLDSIPGLQERITSSDDEVIIVAELVSLQTNLTHH